MANDPKKSLGFLLGEMNGKLDTLLEDRAALGLLTDRVTSLEQSRFKLYTIVATVAGGVGFVFSNLKEGISWMKEYLS